MSPNKAYPRILCWILTHPGNYDTKAVYVKRTWGRKCDILLFASTTEHAELTLLKVNVTEERNALWDKAKQAWMILYKDYLDKADWCV